LPCLRGTVKSCIIAPKSRSRRTPFARVLLEAERERFSSSAAIHCARGRLGHRPVRRVSDREVLAALVPERVLPFASGGSRKRGSSRAEPRVKPRRVPRWGAERRARPLHEVQGSMKSWASVLPQGGRRKDARRIPFRCGSCTRLSALRLPSFKGGVSWQRFLAWLFLA
jgi:hypothetical protein